MLSEHQDSGMWGILCWVYTRIQQCGGDSVLGVHKDSAMWDSVLGVHVHQDSAICRILC